MTFLCTSEKIMILFQLDKGAIENIDERLKESLSIYLKRKEKLQFLKKALYFAPTLDIFTGVILGPLVEEWIFRGILWSKLKSYGEGFAILATTILFAIMHGQGLLLIFLLIGFFSGVLVCLTGNLWYAITFHVIHNLGIFLWENKLFSFSMNMVLTMLLNAGLFLMLLILLLLCSKKNILLHLYYCKKKLLEKIISEKSRLVVFFNTAGIMSFVFYFGVSWLISLVSFGLNL